MKRRGGSPPLFSEETVQVKIFLPKTLFETLKSYIRLKYGKEQKGALSYEIARAIKHYLKEESIPRKKSDIRMPRFLVVYNKVKELIQKTKGEEVKVVSYSDLAWAISVVRGSHPKTIRTWISTFIKMKLIEPVGIERYQFKV